MHLLCRKVRLGENLEGIPTILCGRQGRNAPFEYKNPDNLPPDGVPLNRVSVRYLQEQMGAKGSAAPPAAG